MSNNQSINRPFCINIHNSVKIIYLIQEIYVYLYKHKWNFANTIAGIFVHKIKPFNYKLEIALKKFQINVLQKISQI